MANPAPPARHLQLPAMRGFVYFADIPGVGEKPYLVVSNNARNQYFQEFLVVRITTTQKGPSPTRVVLGHEDAPIVGTVLCDDIELLAEEDLTRYFGALPHTTMMKVGAALRLVLAL